MQSTHDARGLSTARAVLRVTSLLARSPDGMRAVEVAEALDKSVSTAYNLLASLCEEGVAVRGPGALYGLAPGFRRMVATSPLPAVDPGLAALVDDLLARTHKRSYLGVLRAGRLHVVLERGLQGMPRLPGLHPEIRDNAHALAMGKVVLALAGPLAVDGYVRRGLRAFTPHTITRPETLRAQLRDVLRSGIAADREELVEDFCCIAAPLLDSRRRFHGTLGMSMTRRAFDDERESLEETLRDVVRATGFQPCADRRDVLDRSREPALASGGRNP